MDHLQIELTAKQQAYLETIDELCQAHGHAHAKAIAEKLNISMASVTEAMRGLAARELINYQPRQSITLTAQGGAIAAELAKRHHALEEFFLQILGCSKSRSRTIACEVEHIIDERFRQRLTSFVEFVQQKSSTAAGSLIEEFKKSYQQHEDS